MGAAADLAGIGPQLGDTFGISVALGVDVALVGAAQDNTAAGVDSGSVRSFRRMTTGWQEEGCFPRRAGANDSFGSVLALDGPTALASWQGADPFGATCVFRRSGAGWFEEQRLSPREPSTQDRFGHAVAVAGSLVAVGAPGDDPGTAENAGAVYVFDQSATGWTQRARITASRPATGAVFGRRSQCRQTPCSWVRPWK